MLTGIALFGVLTAAIAAFFVEREQGTGVNHNVTLQRGLEEIKDRLDPIERMLNVPEDRPEREH